MNSVRNWILTPLVWVAIALLTIGGCSLDGGGGGGVTERRLEFTVWLERKERRRG
jgi:hypothetical protein